MSVLDIRKENNNIEKIVFSESESSEEYEIAHSLSIWENDDMVVKISDGVEYVLIESAEHARNLQKALNKAIELGWLK